ncbi:hypothetical protein BIW11_07990 [Tropilaelaps mercedesae]|uniref:Uncharacterized protein n=1 Tax=Tropilaelaps mercedesae TaxID=418985 RepID=A0A1V9XRH7_9ACAR|nr:hypothetical protein BIW11_07990 [Tropilaelaps mercedesae]
MCANVKECFPFRSYRDPSFAYSMCCFVFGFAGRRSRLTTLPTRLSHAVTVPLNSVGFFLGHLIHTNEIMVLLSSEILVQVTAPKAVEIVNKRVGECRSRQDKVKEEIKHFSQWAEFTEREKGAPLGEDAEGAVEISEEFDEQHEAAWKEQHLERLRRERARERDELKKASEGADEAALWQRLEELEMEEELQKYEEQRNGRSRQEVGVESAQAEMRLRLSEEDSAKDIVVNRPSPSFVGGPAFSNDLRSILKKRPSDGSLKTVHFQSESDSKRGGRLHTAIDSDDDEAPEDATKGNDHDSPFTGVVVERSNDTGEVIDVQDPPQQKKVSRFKASRNVR